MLCCHNNSKKGGTVAHLCSLWHNVVHHSRLRLLGLSNNNLYFLVIGLLCMCTRSLVYGSWVSGCTLVLWYFMDDGV